MNLLQIISIIATVVSVAGFSVVFTVLFKSYARSTITKIESGERDIELIDEILRRKTENYERKKKIRKIVRTAIFVALLVLIIPMFVFSLINRFGGGRPILGKTFMVVASGSMSQKNSENDYLFENDLGGQFKKYDIIVLNAISSPSDLQRYDIIAYRNNEGKNIIHRIVNISGEGENVRFVMRGDANSANDIYRPGFDDVIGIYRGGRIGFVGIFVMFLQSYPGIITVIALLYCMFMSDAVSKKIEKSTDERSVVLSLAIFGEQGADKADKIREIQYKGFAYRFDSDGNAEKKEIEVDAEDDTMIRTIDGTEPQKIQIKTRKNDGKDQ